ncbi:MAG TPA: hypothetical protein VNX67_02080 [Solirubrobacteraceae bacterium]|jgi:hypothetical protein|nr:hypothetical protein [Solirubrobacteraceae bacterium]
MYENNSHRTHRRVKLPGGRQIEVVYLDGAGESLDCVAGHVPRTGSDAQVELTTARASSDAPVEPQVDRASSDTPTMARPWTGSSPSTAPGEALHVCSRCAGGLVHPLDWVEESPGRWRILMRCPDCDALREGVFGQALVERLDEELDRATGALLSDLRQLTHANMVEEIGIFSRALELDLIGPSDF